MMITDFLVYLWIFDFLLGAQDLWMRLNLHFFNMLRAV